MGDFPLTVESPGKFRFDSYTHTSSFSLNDIDKL